MITGTPAVTVKLLFKIASSAPVATVTLVDPKAAVEVTDTGTVRLVVVDEVGGPAVTSGFANVTTDELLKCVKFPIIVNGMFWAPCVAVFGFTVSRTAVPPVRLNPFDKVTISAPVLSDTLRGPTTAEGSTFITAIAVTALFTVSDATVIPPPKLAVVVPWIQWVNFPVIAINKPC